LDSVRAELPPPPPGLTAEVVGLPVAAARGFALVDADRYLPNLAGIAAAATVLLVGLRRRADAGRAVLAAVLAAGWGFAAAALLGLDLTPLTVALGSLTTAVACEYAVLLSSSAARRASAVRRTVAVAALAATLGYLSLALSGLTVLQEFGLVLAGTVVLAFAAAHLVQRLAPAHRRAVATSTGSPVPAREEVLS
ncbi:MAG: RND transporter, partial [Pseudonocardiaceae bacterium]